MKNLLILIGAPGAGKSTWIKENNLEQYTLSPDNLRLFHSTPVMGVDGKFSISPQNDKRVWEMLDEILEYRMSKGMFTIIDATHTRKTYLNRYNDLAREYGYRLYCKIFNPPLELLLRQNKERYEYKHVPENIIKLHYERLKNLEIPNKFERIEEISETNEFVRYNDVNEYEKVFCIGDIHGCYSVLKEFWKSYSEKHLYIFIGDYLDRGVENKEVLEFLLEIYIKKNVVLLFGNQEQWLKYYAEDQLDKIKGKQFLNNTIPAIKEISKKDIRQLVRKMRTFCSVEHNGRKLIISHGGVSSKNINFINTEQLVSGVGKYEHYEAVADNFYGENRDNEYYMICGHRNINEVPTKYNEKCFNLNGNVEFGGKLRIVSFGASIEVIELQNNVYNTKAQKEHYGNSNLKQKDSSKMEDEFTEENALEVLRGSRDIVEKRFDNISSFNFSRDVFYSANWNDLTTKARGLFLNNISGRIVARSYDKFFNLEEVPETYLSSLKKNLTFPVSAYKKENGYLGIIGYDDEKGEIIYTSKSSLNGNFADWVRELAKPYEDKIKGTVKEGFSIVVEVIKSKKDPHIIEYVKDELVLLDVIKNSFQFEKKCYDELTEIGRKLGLRVKEQSGVFSTFSELRSYILREQKECKDEGYVFEDSKGFMFKLKGDFYKYWKNMRTVKARIENGKQLDVTDNFDTETIQVISFMKKIPIEELKSMSIIDVRNDFLKYNKEC